jgi:hypothetical protein
MFNKLWKFFAPISMADRVLVTKMLISRQFRRSYGPDFFGFIISVVTQKKVCPMSNAAKTLVGGLIIGSVLGIIAGFLAAPSSGKQMRKKLKRKSKKYSKDAVQAVRQYLESNKKPDAKSSSYQQTAR